MVFVIKQELHQIQVFHGFYVVLMEQQDPVMIHVVIIQSMVFSVSLFHLKKLIHVKLFYQKKFILYVITTDELEILFIYTIKISSQFVFYKCNKEKMYFFSQVSR